ncbi:MAG: hypothetical protein HY720_10670 [Planctomycetes bacterium]|nr:hypothetical protein [Planctomycetota bacterium]
MGIEQTPSDAGEPPQAECPREWVLPLGRGWPPFAWVMVPVLLAGGGGLWFVEGSPSIPLVLLLAAVLLAVLAISSREWSLRMDRTGVHWHALRRWSIEWNDLDHLEVTSSSGESASIQLIDGNELAGRADFTGLSLFLVTRADVRRRILGVSVPSLAEVARRILAGLARESGPASAAGQTVYPLATGTERVGAAVGIGLGSFVAGAALVLLVANLAGRIPPGKEWPWAGVALNVLALVVVAIGVNVAWKAVLSWRLTRSLGEGWTQRGRLPVSWSRFGIEDGPGGLAIRFDAARFVPRSLLLMDLVLWSSYWGAGAALAAIWLFGVRLDMEPGMCLLLAGIASLATALFAGWFNVRRDTERWAFELSGAKGTFETASDPIPRSFSLDGARLAWQGSRRRKESRLRLVLSEAEAIEITGVARELPEFAARRLVGRIAECIGQRDPSSPL